MAKGAPRLMTNEMKRYLCEQMAAGRPVSSIVQDPEIKLSTKTINNELNRDPVFLTAYMRARDAGVEPKTEEIEDILVGRGEWAKVPFDVRKEVANDRRWTAIRLARYRYGDKLDVNSNVKVIEGRVIEAEALDLDQLIAVREALVAAIEGPDEEYEDDV